MWNFFKRKKKKVIDYLDDKYKDLPGDDERYRLRTTKAVAIVYYIATKFPNQFSNLQMNLMLYYLYAKYHRLYGLELFDDYFESWSFGPVVPRVYYHFCGSGAMCLDFRWMEKSDMDTGFDLIQPFEKYFIEKYAIKFTCLPIAKEYDIMNKSYRAWKLVYGNNGKDKHIVPKELIWEDDIEFFDE